VLPLTAAAFALSIAACSSKATDAPSDDSAGAGGDGTSLAAGGNEVGGSTTGSGGSSAGGSSGAGGSSSVGGGSAAGGSSGVSGEGGVASSCSGSTYQLPAGAVVCSCPTLMDRQNCTADKNQPMFDNGEWEGTGNMGGPGPNGAPLGSFGGWWGHWLPLSPKGCIQNIPMPGSTSNWGQQYANPMLTTPNPLDATSKAGMSLKGMGCTTPQEIYDADPPDTGCDNLSAFQGFKFDALGDSAFDMTVFVSDKGSPGHAKHTVVVHVTAAWQEFDVPFCSLGNAGTFNAANVNTLGFQISAPNFQVWWDDIKFY
jgi:hypothetical protein